jgi:hypothetical protein
VGILAALGVAVFPTLIFVSGILYPTTLYTLLLLGATLAARAVVERPTARRAAAFGALLGAGWLTDQVFIIPGFVLVLWCVAAAGSARLRVAGMTAAVVVVLAGVMAGYQGMIRDPGRAPAPFMMKAQFVLHYARTDSVTAERRRIRLPADTRFRALGRGDLLAREWGLLRERPGDYLHDVGSEFLHFFDPMPDRIQSDTAFTSRAVLVVGAVSFLPVLILALLGLVAGRAARRDRLLLVLVPLATAGFYAFFFTQTRYRIPVEPHLLVLAALGLVRFGPRRLRDVLPSPTPGESRSR